MQGRFTADALDHTLRQELQQHYATKAELADYWKKEDFSRDMMSDLVTHKDLGGLFKWAIGVLLAAVATAIAATGVVVRMVS